MNKKMISKAVYVLAFVLAAITIIRFLIGDIGFNSMDKSQLRRVELEGTFQVDEGGGEQVLTIEALENAGAAEYIPMAEKIRICPLCGQLEMYGAVFF